jgi:uncharacterized protein (UPF0261 family)
MMTDKTILVVGTYDTKDAELNYLCDRIHQMGGGVVSMDVSVLGNPSQPTDISKHMVAEAGGSSIQIAIESGDENIAMQIMAGGASAKALELYQNGTIDGVIVLGGTMGTDLALDVCSALPLGVPKYIVSTVSFSAMLPPDRLAADIQMILWAGGLYGLNSICKSSLSQAAGAVLGAARAVEPPKRDRPLIGMTSFGKTILHYMVTLKPALEERGFEVAVFHATGMGGRAFESLASQGAFAAVMDFAPQEVCNQIFGSGITAGRDRMTNAGAMGIPQMIAPACYDLVDLIGWQDLPEQFKTRESHAHNRLLTSVVLDTDERRHVARTFNDRLKGAIGPVTYFLPTHGCNEWDRTGGPLSDADGLAAFIDETRKTVPENVDLIELECHINDDMFCERVLNLFDTWIETGVIRI